jgi:indole-3-glycerol phosphate synthase
VQAFLHPWTPPTGTLGRLVFEAENRAGTLLADSARLERAAAGVPPAPALAAALRRADVAVVAEVKRRSPSRGAINPDLAAERQAAAYAAGGAAALSILTEPTHFGGSDDDLRAARAAAALPLLKKDFHVHPVQLVHAKALGASAALLIARAVRPDTFLSLVAEGRGLELEMLVEVRDERELDRALETGCRLVGVNNRDLETLHIDPEISARLIPRIPADCIAVYESGITGVEGVRQAAATGADAVLVGSGVSAAANPQAAVRALVGVPRSPRGS